MDKMIYISHKYGGDELNKCLIEEIIEELHNEYPTYCFVSPVHCFGFLYRDVSYDDGMAMCLELLSKCDECWVYGEISKGVAIEIQYCIDNDIPFKEKIMR